MTTGDPLVLRVAMKPPSPLPRPLQTVHLDSHEPDKAITQRSDACAVPRAGVLEHVVAHEPPTRCWRRPAATPSTRSSATSPPTSTPSPGDEDPDVMEQDTPLVAPHADGVGLQKAPQRLAAKLDAVQP